MREITLTDEQILSQFISSAERLHVLIEGMSEAGLDTPSEDGGWTVRQIVHHISDDCDVWSMCIKKAIATPGVMVRFEGFPGNEVWAQALDFNAREIEPAVQLILAHRRYLAEILNHFSDKWELCVRFGNARGEIVGEMSVREMVKMLGNHLLEHVETIEGLKKRENIRSKSEE